MTRVAVLGAGITGLDLIERIQASPHLACRVVVGGQRLSTGLRRVADMGLQTATGGPAVLMQYASSLDLIFDASDAATHSELSTLLAGRGPKVIDLTPSHLGVPVVPTVNAHAALTASDISLISCAGQASVPVAHAVAMLQQPRYVEVVTTAASATAGPATRRNLDEFVECTQTALATFTGAPMVKVLANISPARPAPPFRLVIRIQADGLESALVRDAVDRAARDVRVGVPAYLVTDVSVCADLATVTIEVTATGSWIPRQAGNVEIISAAALALAEYLATADLQPAPHRCPGVVEIAGAEGGPA